MNWETLITKYPDIANIKSEEQAQKWAKVLSLEEQEALTQRWPTIIPEEKKDRENNDEDNEGEKENKEKGKQKEEGGHGGGHGGPETAETDKKKTEDEEEEEKKQKKDTETNIEEESPPPYTQKPGPGEKTAEGGPGEPGGEEKQEGELNDYKSFAENPTDDPKVAKEFIEKHKGDNIPENKVEEFKKKSGLDLGGVKKISPKPPITGLTALKSLAKKATMEVKGVFYRYQLSYEALPNIQAKNDELQKDIEKKWKLIQEEHPEAKDFKTEDEFKKWASNLPPEQKKSLQTKWLASGNSTIISLNDAWAYKRVSEPGNNSIAKKTPSLIFKLYTQFFRPLPTTSAITKQGKTDQEYAGQFNNQSPSVKKSILRHEKKRAKKLKKKEGGKNKGKPTGYRKKFEEMYAYLFDNNLKNTPPEYAAADVASQEYHKSKKKYDPIWAAVVVEELVEFAPPPPPSHL